MGNIERFLEQQSERMATAWRRIRQTQLGEATPAVHMLDGVVEPFFRELAASLRGADGSAWSRTRGVLRLSPSRGVESLKLEFDALGLCLTGALSTLATPTPARGFLLEQLHEARTSARALLRRLEDPQAPTPRVPFGGLVVEYFESEPRQPIARVMPLH